MQRHHGRDRHRQHGQTLGRDHRAKDMNVGRRHQRRKRLRLRTVEILDHLLQKQRQRDGRDHQRQHAVLEHRIDDDQLEHQPEDDHRQRNADQTGQPERRAPIHRRQDEKRRQHDEFALGEIDRLRRLPQQRESDRNQGIDRPGREAGYQELNEAKPLALALGFRPAVIAGRKTERQAVTCRASAESERSSACRRRLRPGSFHDRCRRSCPRWLPSECWAPASA